MVRPIKGSGPGVFLECTATPKIYPLSLHDALPISATRAACAPSRSPTARFSRSIAPHSDRKSTRLNSSHSQISYADFCLKKKIFWPALGRTDTLEIDASAAIRDIEIGRAHVSTTVT